MSRVLRTLQSQLNTCNPIFNAQKNPFLKYILMMNSKDQIKDVLKTLNNISRSSFSIAKET